jgi:poly-gamma-glutamate capsule biosynthesis protein CapA/YwtB (metallophosphatase superfamily)
VGLFGILIPCLLIGRVPAASSGDDVTLICVGDVMMAHGMKRFLEKKGPDYPFERVRSILKSGDIVFGNLENPISRRGKRAPDKDYHFRMDPPHAEALPRAGFRVMSLANNHIFDYGEAAFRDTLEELGRLGIQGCGAGLTLAEARQPAIVSVGKKRVAFLAYHRTPPLSFSATARSPGTAIAETTFLREDIPAARARADWVIVSFHWGKEYTAVPPKKLRRLAQAAVEAGADAVLGHHPHVVQGFEVHKGKIIAYSLGNFAFGTRNPNAKESVILKLTLFENGSARAEIIPISVDNRRVHFQPRPLEGPPAEKFLQRLRRLSKKLRTDLRVEGERAYLP